MALNDPGERRRVERRGGYFIVEGLVAIERLLATPSWQVRSLLLLPRLVERLKDRLVDLDAPVMVADEAVLQEVVGFPMHRGALASVTRVAPQRLDGEALTDLLRAARSGDHHGRRPLLMVVEGVNDHENLGALYRNARALGTQAVVLDSTSADPFYRRSVRVSSGLVLTVPTFRVETLPATIETLRWGGVTTVALTPDGEVDLNDLDEVLDPRGPVALIVGAEGPGLTEATSRAADHRAAIAMAADVDSLNVATAAAIALHQLGHP